MSTGTTADLADRDTAQELAAATLRRVRDEATRIAGGPVGEVRLVVPAGWGPRRRTWLRGAAQRAGIEQPDLITGPVAVAGLLPVMGVPVPDDATVLILDIGHGCEATVLRRDHHGFDVSSTVHDPHAGGDALDELLLTYLNSPADGATTDAPAAEADRTAQARSAQQSWALLASVRAGKETLSHRASATVGLPPPAPATGPGRARPAGAARPPASPAAGPAGRRPPPRRRASPRTGPGSGPAVAVRRRRASEACRCHPAVIEWAREETTAVHNGAPVRSCPAVVQSARDLQPVPVRSHRGRRHRPRRRRLGPRQRPVVGLVHVAGRQPGRGRPGRRGTLRLDRAAAVGPGAGRRAGVAVRAAGRGGASRCPGC